MIGSCSAEECLNMIVSKVCGVTVQTRSHIGAAVVWISKMTIGVKGLPYTGAAVAEHLKKQTKKPTKSKKWDITPRCSNLLRVRVLSAGSIDCSDSRSIVTQTLHEMCSQKTKSTRLPLNAHLSYSWRLCTWNSSHTHSHTGVTCHCSLEVSGLDE